MNTFENAIFRWVVGVILGRDLEESRERLCVPVYDGSDLLGNVLVDEQNGNVLALYCELCKRLLDVCDRCLLEDVSTGRKTGNETVPLTLLSTMRKFFSPFSSTFPMPASKRPVVESCVQRGHVSDLYQ